MLSQDKPQQEEDYEENLKQQSLSSVKVIPFKNVQRRTLRRPLNEELY